MNLDVLNKIKLKKEGIATLQVFFIFVFGSLEYIVRHSFAIITGVVVLLMFILGNRFGRPGVHQYRCRCKRVSGLHFLLC